MTEADQPEAAPSDKPGSPNDSTPSRSERLRRLHTLSGGVVLGLFLALHLLTNASVLGGPARYDAVVGALERSKLLPLFELLIFVPLAFHLAYGIQLLRRSRQRDVEPSAGLMITPLRYGDRRLWIVQRISATFVLLFVVVHVWELRIQRLFFGLSADALHTVLTAHLSWTWGGVPWLALFYVLGMAATALHFSNGLFAATAAWNIGTTEPARRRMRVITVLCGALLFLVGTATVIGFATGTLLFPGSDDTRPCGSAASDGR